MATSATMTLTVYAGQWLEHRALKPRTRDHYRKLLDARILPVLGDATLRRLSPADVRHWYARASSQGRADITCPMHLRPALALPLRFKIQLESA